MGKVALSSSSSNDTECTAKEILPYAVDYFAELTTAELIGVVVCAGLSLLILLMFTENVWFLIKFVTSKRTRYLSVWQIGLHPVFASLALLAVVVPRSSLLCDLVASVYLAICIHVFLRLIVVYHGGSTQMLSRMAEDKIPLRSPPLACCCCCCPVIALTRQNFNRIKLCVVQVTFLRPVLMFLAAALWTDGRYTKGGFSGSGGSAYITIISAISTLVAMYGLILVYRASRKYLQQYHLVPKFLNLQFVLLFSGIQQLIFIALQKNNLPRCKGSLSTAARANALFHMILIGEMFLLAILARCYYRRQEVIPETIGEMTNDPETEKKGLKENNEESCENLGADGVYKETEDSVTVHTIAQ